jgi:cell division protein FtsL
MTKLWDTLRNKTQQMLLEQENEELKWEQKYKKEHKLRQEAETETILVKGIGMNSPEMKSAKQKIEELQKEIDRIKKENNELYNRIADLTEADSRLQKARESGL